MASAMETRTGVVVDMGRSPHVSLRPVPVGAVQLRDLFWEPRIRINRDVTLLSQLQHCEETGRLANFRIAAGKEQGTFEGIYFNDSDVYKWVEAASWSLATHADPALETKLDAVIADIAAAQQPDGYLNTYFMFERAAQRYTNLKDMHEIYCAGHLFQAAAAHFRATGKRTLLDTALRLADHQFEIFGPGKRIGACGHEEAEMGLVELYRLTAERRYLELAECMIEARGHKPGILGGSSYHQDHAPFKDQTEMVGHAVRHLYLCCGAADIVAETGRTDYMAALDALWQNFTRKKMYVTGGAGGRWEGEAFGNDYELPNERAYTETCAAIASVMWNWRMLQITGLPQFADVMEMTLYNAVLPGLSLDGTQYFYQNPLADRGAHRRQSWFGCACCPPNVARLLASLSGYFYSTSDAGIYVHLYAESTASITLRSGAEVTLHQKTEYPWNGDISLTVGDAPTEPFGLYLRVPFWADPGEVRISVNGEDITDSTAISDGQYSAVRRTWKKGDTVVLRLAMPVELVESHPYVLNNRGRVALQRGPLIYCVEQADNPGADIYDLVLPDGIELRPEAAKIFDHAIVALAGTANVQNRDEWAEALYAPFQPADEAIAPRVPIKAIPYYAWANRDRGPMLVWLPISSSS